jgi:hypothetical protein
MNDERIITEIAKELNITVSETSSSFSKQMLVDKINELVATDMHKLIFILYRMDVNETKMRSILKDNPDSDAGILIADLMIERQVEKIKSRQQFRQRDNNIDEDEKW